MIRDHLNQSWWVFKLKMSLFKDANNNHEFFVIDLIIALDRIMFLEEVHDEMKYVILVVLW